MGFYTGEKLLSSLDVNKKKPELYLCTDLRSSGKTTFFVKMLTNRFLKTGEKFVYLVRFNNELDDLSKCLYEDVGSLFFKGRKFESSIKGGFYSDIRVDGVTMGYGLAINSADKIKRKSHMFVGASSIMFDEFQSENNHYCPSEVQKFMSIHKSLARGGGKGTRYLPVYMLSNHITLLNPYFTALGVTDLHRSTRYRKGDGFVLEQLFNSQSMESSKESGFDRAFSNTDYSKMTGQGIYLNDDTSYIVKPKGLGRYRCTIIYNGREYGIVNYDDYSFIGNSVDKTFPLRYTIKRDEIGGNSQFISRCPSLVDELRKDFATGDIRFSDLSAKDAMIHTISY